MVRRAAAVDLPAEPTLEFEAPLWTAGVLVVAGLDEAGRGAWAGPVSAAAVILPSDADILHRLHGVNDSKQLSARQRSRLAVEIQSAALAWGVGFAACTEIDANGIVPATRLAMRRALEQLCPAPQHLLIDALRLPGINLPQTAIIKGDARCLSIAAASILAKTARDQHLIELDERYPGYGFAVHKGYGTRRHQDALARLGPCAEHRTSFAPIRTRLGESLLPAETI